MYRKLSVDRRGVARFVLFVPIVLGGRLQRREAMGLMGIAQLSIPTALATFLLTH